MLLRPIGSTDHNTALSRQTELPPDLLSHSEKAKSIKRHEISYDTLTLKSSFKKPDTSLYTCCGLVAHSKLPIYSLSMQTYTVCVTSSLTGSFFSFL